MQNASPLPSLAGRPRAYGAVLLLLLLLQLLLSSTLAPAVVVRKKDGAASVADDPTNGGATKAQAVVQHSACLCNFWEQQSHVDRVGGRYILSRQGPIAKRNGFFRDDSGLVAV